MHERKCIIERAHPLLILNGICGVVSWYHISCGVVLYITSKLNNSRHGDTTCVFPSAPTFPVPQSSSLLCFSSTGQFSLPVLMLIQVCGCLVDLCGNKCDTVEYVLYFAEWYNSQQVPVGEARPRFTRRFVSIDVVYDLVQYAVDCLYGTLFTYCIWHVNKSVVRVCNFHTPKGTFCSVIDIFINY